MIDERIRRSDDLPMPALKRTRYEFCFRVPILVYRVREEMTELLSVANL